MKKENKTFYSCELIKKSVEEARQKKELNLPDMLSVIWHNQTILNDKVNKILNKLNI